MEKVHYGGEDPHWAVVPMKKKKKHAWTTQASSYEHGLNIDADFVANEVENAMEVDSDRHILPTYHTIWQQDKKIRLVPRPTTTLKNILKLR